MKHTKFQSLWIGGALSLGLIGAGATGASAQERPPIISDASGVILSDVLGTTLTILDIPLTIGDDEDLKGLSNAFTQNPRGFAANFKSLLGRFGVSAKNLIDLLNQNRSAALEKSGSEKSSQVARAPWYYQANAQAAPAMAGKGEIPELSGSAQRVATAGEEFSEVIAQLVNAKGRINPLSLGPSISATRSLRSALSSFVDDLKKVPVKSLTPEQLRALNVLVDDTSHLTTALENVTPVLDALSKRANSKTTGTKGTAATGATSGAAGAAAGTKK